MFNLKDLQDMGKLANQAHEMQKQQDQKHREQINLLHKISDTLDKIYNELKRSSN